MMLQVTILHETQCAKTRFQETVMICFCNTSLIFLLVLVETNLVCQRTATVISDDSFSSAVPTNFQSPKCLVKWSESLSDKKETLV